MFLNLIGYKQPKYLSSCSWSRPRGQWEDKESIWVAERSCRWGETACVPCSSGCHGNTPHPQPAPAKWNHHRCHRYCNLHSLPFHTCRNTNARTWAGVSPFGPRSPPTDAVLRRRLASSLSLCSSLSLLSSISSSWASLLLSSRCFIRTATTTLTSTNWAVRTKVTK